MSRYWWNQDVIVNVDYDEVMEQIPTSVLEEVLKERKELQHSDIKEFERQESRRGGGIDINIDPSDYDLINEEDISVSDFTDAQIIDTLERRGYTVVSRDEDFGGLDNVANFLYNIPNHKFKDFLCDTLGLSHLVTNEYIINEIKNRI